MGLRFWNPRESLRQWAEDFGARLAARARASADEASLTLSATAIYAEPALYREHLARERSLKRHLRTLYFSAMPEPKIHELKCTPEFFVPLADGRKTFEVRNNDRGYSVGDLLVLREWTDTFEPNDLPRAPHYTGRWIVRVVSYVLDANYFLMAPGFVVLGFELGDGSAFNEGEALRDRPDFLVLRDRISTIVGSML